LQRKVDGIKNAGSEAKAAVESLKSELAGKVSMIQPAFIFQKC
jgi:hypothetical protein